jgi:protein SCO1/2
MRWVWLSGMLGIAIILASTMMWFGHEHFTHSAAKEMASLSPAAGSATGKASIGGAFTLTDQNGNIATAADLKGKFSLVAFGFTFCPDVCPTTLSTMTEALNRIGDAADAIQPVFISVDPERDTPETMKQFASAFHPRLLALSGSPEQTREVTDAYKVYYYARKENPGDKNYLVDHSSFIYLMGPDGEYITHFSYSIPPSELAVKLSEIVQNDGVY